MIHHVISHPCFCSSRSIFLVLDFITDVDADKSEFFLLSQVPQLQSHSCLQNIYFEYWFQSLQELNTKLCLCAVRHSILFEYDSVWVIDSNRISG